MGKMIYAGSKGPKPKKKPGWKEAAAQEAEWLKNLNSMTLFTDGRKVAAKTSTKKAAPHPTRVMRELPAPAKSLIEAVPIGGTKKVVRPEIQYKDDPEMAERERKAREVRFPTAPAYNKGGDVLVTPELMRDITAGKTRRR